MIRSLSIWSGRSPKVGEASRGAFSFPVKSIKTTDCPVKSIKTADCPVKSIKTADRDRKPMDDALRQLKIKPSNFSLNANKLSSQPFAAKLPTLIWVQNGKVPSMVQGNL